MSDPTGTTASNPTPDPGAPGQAPMPMLPPRKKGGDGLPSAFQEAVAPTTQSLRLPTGSMRPTDIAKTNAVNAERARRGLPPLPRRRGERKPGKGSHFVRSALIVGFVVAVVFGGTSVWAYVSGVIGPLRGAERHAAQVLALADDAPDWASPEQLACASQRLVRDEGLVPLARAGVLTGPASDYSYSGRWPSNIAVTWYKTMLGCAGSSHRWARSIADSWSLHDGTCLRHIGADRLSGVLAATGVALTDGDLRTRNVATMQALDDCYAKTPGVPTGAATSGYREVGLVVTGPAIADGVPSIQVEGAEPTSDSGKTKLTFSLPVARGGDEACVRAQTEATYAWGTVRRSDPADVCGKATPARIVWKKVDHTCHKGVKTCTYEALFADGLGSGQALSVTYRASGDFSCAKGKKACTVKLKADDTGRVRAPAIDVTGRHKGHLDARMGSLRALFPAN